MPKLRPKMTVRQSPFPGLLDVRFPFNREVQKTLVAYPGARYAPEIAKGAWVVPAELSPLLEKLSGAYDLQLDYFVPSRASEPQSELDSRYYDFQRRDIHNSLRERRHMLNYEMGLGKTPTAIGIARLHNCERVLVVCPAIVRLEWAKQLEKWWPGHGYAVHVFESGAGIGKTGPIEGRAFVSTSYELLDKTVAQNPHYDMIVVDESQYIASSSSRRSKAVRSVVDANPDARLLMLSATPWTNKIDGLWFQLDTLHPGRWGSWPKFVRRYAVVLENEYTKWDIRGLDPAKEEELRDRLAHVSSRVTKKEVAHLLPPLLVDALRVRPRKGTATALRSLSAEFAGMRQHENDPGALIRAAKDDKVKAAADWYSNLREVEEQPWVCISTHFRETAEELEALLAHKYPDTPIVRVHGGDVPKDRMEKIAALEKQGEGGVLITTMHAVNVGVDLTRFEHILMAELDWTPANLVQFVGRFSRLSRTDASAQLTILMLEGTADEIMAEKILQKMRDIVAVIQSGISEDGLLTGLGGSALQTEEDLLADLKKSLSTSCFSIDEYA